MKFPIRFQNVLTFAQHQTRRTSTLVYRQQYDLRLKKTTHTRKQQSQHFEYNFTLN